MSDLDSGSYVGEPLSQIFWSAGRGLNPRIQVLQTCALAASPPALMVIVSFDPALHWLRQISAPK
jgi:hypothetical protein